MINNDRLIEKLIELSAECTALSDHYDPRLISSPRRGLIEMSASLTFLANAIRDNVLGLANLPDIGYSFIQATQKNLTKLTNEKETA